MGSLLGKTKSNPRLNNNINQIQFSNEQASSLEVIGLFRN